MRDEGAKHQAEPRPDGANPWASDRPAPPVGERPTLAQLGTPAFASAASVETEDDRAERYSVWAERMHEKRRRLHQDNAGEPAPSYWTTNALFEESRRVEEDEAAIRPNPWHVQELLATLDLREGATSSQISDAYRRLAKTHHPDRYLEADEATQEFHAGRMRDIISAYRTLKTLQKT